MQKRPLPTFRRAVLGAVRAFRRSFTRAGGGAAGFASLVAVAALGLHGIPGLPFASAAEAGGGAETAPSEAGTVPARPGSTAASTETPARPSARLDPALAPPRRGGDGSAEGWAPRRAPFDVRVDGEAVVHRVEARIVLPGEVLRIRAERDASFAYGAGAAVELAPGRWSWTAPGEPGAYAARVSRPMGQAVDLTLLVAHPRDHVEGGTLHGYRIGRYVEKPLRGLPRYRPPEAFVEVGELDRDILVAPHFTLGQFLCKQPGEPSYVALSLPLLRKLEAVLDATNRAGLDAPTFHVMSGFRTPAYNRAIGNTTVYSRHLWGDAADIFVDADGDGDMDDLNGDGRVNVADARLLAGIVEGVEDGARGVDDVTPGGMGVYRRNSAHGPFVHVDARGYRARW